MPEQKQTQKEIPQEKILPMPESERFAKEAMKALLGDKENLKAEERKLWDRLAAKQGYEEEKEKIISELKNLGYRAFHYFADKLEREGEIAGDTREKLAAFREEQERFFATIGKTMRAEGPSQYKNVAEEEEILAMKEFIKALRNLNIDEVIAMIIADNDFIRMLEELQEGKPYEGKYAMLDENNPQYEQNMDNLYHFMKRTIDPKTGALTQTGGAETIMWGLIVKKLDPERRMDLFAKFFSGPKEKPKDIGAGLELLRDLVATGVFTKQDAMDLLTKIKAPGFEGEASLKRNMESGATIVKLNEYDEALKGASEAFAELQKHKRGAVEYMRRKVRGNPAGHFLTFGKAIAYELFFTVGALGVLGNAAVPIIGAFGVPGWKNKIKALPGAITKIPSEPFFASLALVGLSTEIVSSGGIGKGWISSKFLYPESKLSKETRERKEKEQKLHEELGKRPNLPAYMYRYYEHFLRRADTNKTVYGSHVLLPRDILLNEDDAKKLGFKNTKEAKTYVAGVFKVLAFDLKKTNQAALKVYFEEKNYSLSS